MNESPEDKRNRWNGTLLQVQRDLWPEPTLPPHLYHYSTLGNIESIIRSREIWLNDIRKVKGDKNDGTHWIELFRTVLNRKSVPDYVKRIFQATTLGLGSEWHLDIACFSAEPDLEYQWENYADRNQGCAIELSFESLAKQSDEGKLYAYGTMLYDEHEKIRVTENTIDAAIQLARNEDMNPSERKEFWQSYATLSFIHCGLRFKGAKFFREREWRVLSTRLDSDGLQRRALALPPEMVTGVIKGSACNCPDSDLAALLGSAGYLATVHTRKPTP